MKNVHSSALVERFKNECEVINLKNEYPGYMGDIQWAVVTSLSEVALRDKYSELLTPYDPFIVLDEAFRTAQSQFIRNEEKHRWRRRTGHIFPIDETFDEHHPECCESFDDDSRFLREELEEAIGRLNEGQQRRIRAFFFQGKTEEEIAKEENITQQGVSKSIREGLKKLKKYL